MANFEELIDTCILDTAFCLNENGREPTATAIAMFLAPALSAAEGEALADVEATLYAQARVLGFE